MADIDPAYITSHTQLPYFEPTYTTDLYPAPVGINSIPYSTAFNQPEAPLNIENLAYFPPPPTYGVTPEPADWQRYFNLSPSSTPTSSEHTDYDMEMPYMDPNPGPSLSTSLNVTPHSEGLETPTFTPCYSPVSVATPQQPLSPRKYACEYESCGHKEFDRPCDLNKHLKTHNKHLECDFEPNGGCQMKFSTEKDRKRHRETVHEKLRPYVCHICVKEGAEGKEGRFSRKDNLRIHRKKVHGVE